MNSYSPSWSHVSFYVPQDTPNAQRDARRFIKKIRSMERGVVISRGNGCGLFMGSPEKIESALLPLLPGDGELRIVGVTDKQFEKTRVHWGQRRTLAIL